MAATIEGEKHKEKPRYKVQRQYEKRMKEDYAETIMKMVLTVLGKAKKQ